MATFGCVSMLTSRVDCKCVLSDPSGSVAIENKGDTHLRIEVLLLVSMAAVTVGHGALSSPSSRPTSRSPRTNIEGRSKAMTRSTEASPRRSSRPYPNERQGGTTDESPPARCERGRPGRARRRRVAGPGALCRAGRRRRSARRGSGRGGARTGVVDARIVAGVGARITGVVTEVLVDVGDTVEAGTLLVRLEDSALVARLAAARSAATAAGHALASAEAEIDRAASALELARRTATRQRSLAGEGVAPKPRLTRRKLRSSRPRPPRTVRALDCWRNAPSSRERATSSWSQRSRLLTHRSPLPSPVW